MKEWVLTVLQVHGLLQVGLIARGRHCRACVLSLPDCHG